MVPLSFTPYLPRPFDAIVCHGLLLSHLALYHYIGCFLFFGSVCIGIGFAYRQGERRQAGALREAQAC